MSHVRPRPRRIRRLAPACSILPLLALLSSCGGSSKPNTATSGTPGGATAGPLSLADHLPPINEFPRLHPISLPNVIVEPSTWVASTGLPGTPGQADAARLARIGFLAGVAEELGSAQPTVAQVDAQVEQFRSAGAAAAEVAYRLGQARATGHSPGYTFSRLQVPGVPGAAGYAIKQPSSSSDAVAFANGRFFYLIQSVLPSGSQSVITPRQVTREAAAWYQHLQKL